MDGRSMKRPIDMKNCPACGFPNPPEETICLSCGLIFINHDCKGTCCGE